jgi:putative aminopeptidase FrvX
MANRTVRGALPPRARAAALLIALCAAGALSQGVRRSELFDAPQLLRDLQALSADDMQGRQVGTPGGEKARAYVLRRFKESGIQPFGSDFAQPFAFTGGRAGTQTERKGANVVGVVNGTKTPGRYIVMTAHYDHIGVRDGQVFNGADDNASGTAALFAVGKYFSAHPPANSLIVAAFDGEESGLRGANAFLKTPPVPVTSMAVNVNLDMIGRDPADTLYAAGTYAYPFLKPYVDRVASKAPVKLLAGHDDPTKKSVEDWTRDSDHYAFHQQKIPFIYLGVEDFDQHHKATDDYETMSHDFYVRAVETAIRLIQEFDANLDAIAKSKGD